MQELYIYIENQRNQLFHIVTLRCFYSLLDSQTTVFCNCREKLCAK